MNLEYGLFPKRHPMPWELTPKEHMEAYGTKLPERRCNHCGKMFFPLERRTTCCSVKCGVRHSRDVKAGLVRGYNLREEPADKRCAICDSLFTPLNGRQKYCKPRCVRAAKKESAKRLREQQRAGT